MFSRLKAACASLYSSLHEPLRKFFAQSPSAQLSITSLEELRKILLNADVGLPATERIIAAVRTKQQSQANTLPELMEQALLELLPPAIQPSASDRVMLLVGVNGSGKTTSAAKLASQAHAAGKKVLLVAADTFRAAATEQLHAWGTSLGVPVVTGAAGQDPAAVVYAGCAQFRTGAYDLMIIDTAGRLQTKKALMEELAKVRRVITKQLPTEQVTTLLTVDSTLGQNSLQQALLFNESTPLNGIILTKCDGSGKGGIIFSIVHQLRIPIAYVTLGETAEGIYQFDAAQFVKGITGAAAE